MTDQNNINFNAADFDITSGAFELDDSVLKSVATDSGSATPSAHSFSVLGINGVSTTGSGDDLEIGYDGDSSAFVLLDSVSASGSASVSFTGLSSTYFVYLIVCTDIYPGSQGAELLVRTSSNNGVSYDAASGNYCYGVFVIEDGSLDDQHDDSDTEIEVANNLSQSNLCNGRIWLINPSNSSEETSIIFDMNHSDYAGASPDTMRYATGFGLRVSAALVDAIQILMSTGTITGKIYLYGVMAS